MLRIALEHWDEDNRGAHYATAHSVDAGSHVWDVGGSGTLGGLVDDEDLRWWAEAVYLDVVAMDVR